MTDDEVHSALVRWLSALTGVQVIKTHQSGPAPAGAYIAVNFTGAHQLRQHAQDIVLEDGDTADMETADQFPPVTATPVMEVEWRFSLHAYGPTPTDLLRPIRSAAQLSQRQESLLPQLVIHDISQIRNVPDWLNEAWEPRAQMDMVLRGLTHDGLVIDVIEEAPFEIDRAN